MLHSAYGVGSPDTDVDVVTPSLVEMGSMVNVCAATKATGTSNTSANFMMVDGWPADGGASLDIYVMHRLSLVSPTMATSYLGLCKTASVSHLSAGNGILTEKRHILRH